MSIEIHLHLLSYVFIGQLLTATAIDLYGTLGRIPTQKLFILNLLSVCQICFLGVFKYKIFWEIGATFGSRIRLI